MNGIINTRMLTAVTKPKHDKLAEINPRFTEGMDACNLDIMLESTVTNELIKSMGQYSLQVGPQFDNRPRQVSIWI